MVINTSEYISCFGFLRGTFFLAARAARLYPSGKIVPATVPGSDIQLLVRLGTPDIMVFNDLYHGKEQDWKFEVAPETIMDAGAYTGLSTAYFAARYPGAKIIAIEPSEDNFALLLRNVSKLENVHAINAALWSEPGSLVLTDPGRDYWGFVVQESDTDAGPDQNNALVPTSKVDALTVSDLMSDYEVDRVNLLKLDIEGSEKEVFSNARPWIDRVDAISIELHDRFKPGCARAFFGAVTDFPTELRRGEKILVIRDGSPLGLVSEHLTDPCGEYATVWPGSCQPVEPAVHRPLQATARQVEQHRRRQRGGGHRRRRVELEHLGGQQHQSRVRQRQQPGYQCVPHIVQATAGPLRERYGSTLPATGVRAAS
jgi:FkbM family methyltransferase